MILIKGVELLQNLEWEWLVETLDYSISVSYHIAAYVIYHTAAYILSGTYTVCLYSMSALYIYGHVLHPRHLSLPPCVTYLCYIL